MLEGKDNAESLKIDATPEERAAWDRYFAAINSMMAGNDTYADAAAQADQMLKERRLRFSPFAKEHFEHVAEMLKQCEPQYACATNGRCWKHSTDDALTAENARLKKSETFANDAAHKLIDEINARTVENDQLKRTATRASNEIQQLIDESRELHDQFNTLEQNILAIWLCVDGREGELPRGIEALGQIQEVYTKLEKLNAARCAALADIVRIGDTPLEGREELRGLLELIQRRARGALAL